MEIGHVHLKVQNLDESVEFYRKVFGLRIEEETGRYVFLSGDGEHHLVALQQVHGDPVTATDHPGLYHVAFEVEDEDRLKEIHDRARKASDRLSAVDHGISRSIYFEDPSGNGIEVYVDTREITGTNRWEGRTEPYSFGESETE